MPLGCDPGEVTGEQRHVLAPFGQRWGRDLHRRDPPGEGGCDRGGIIGDGDIAIVRAQSVEQPGLADLVEPVGMAEQPARPPLGSIEPLPSQRIAYVDPLHRSPGGAGGGMDRGGDQAAPGPRRSGHDDARHRRPDAADQVAHPADGGTVAQQACGFDGVPGRCQMVARYRTTMGGDLDLGDQLGIAPRLHHEVARARLHRGDGQPDAAMRGDDDDARARIVGEQPVEHCQPFRPVGSPDGIVEVEQDRVVALGRQTRKALFRPLRHVQPVPRQIDRDGQRFGDARIVVDDQDRKRA